MTATVTTSTLIGFESRLIYIESDMSNSLPGTVIVGLGDKSISEAKERIRSAIKNSKLEHPKKRITINLSPADLPKDGSQYDLGMALSVLQLSRQLPDDSLTDTLVLGELGLDGTIRPIHGIIGHLLGARKAGISRAIFPVANLREAQLIDGIELAPVQSLRELCEKLSEKISLTAPSKGFKPDSTGRYDTDMADIAGQAAAKRGLEIAAAGGHNILLSGPPGGGKTMLARSLPSILPPLTKEEIIECTYLHSMHGAAQHSLIETPPFRSPHHSASHISLVGGGTKPSPGEVSLAHNGVLFLDEIPEFSRQALESLRQPLEDGIITVSRAQATATYPAASLMVATRNPCPCGYFGDRKRTCDCSQVHIDTYQRKLSGPLLDRIDIYVYVEPTDHAVLLKDSAAETSDDIRRRVIKARAQQMQRHGKAVSQLSSRDVKQQIQLSPQVVEFLNEAADSLSLSSRSYIKVIKVARTIADLEASPQVMQQHLAEALQFRKL